MSDGEVLLGVVNDGEGDEIRVYADAGGTVSLDWDRGHLMVLGRTARDQLRDLLDRAAMPGQAT